MKKCIKCKLYKRKCEFHFNKFRRGGLQDACKVCQNKYTKIHYKRNKLYYKEKGKINRNASKKRAYTFLIEYCKLHPCRCGEKDFTVLDFNHINRKSKVNNISTMVTKGFSISKINAEVKKCEVMCANCHRRHTAKQMNWYRVLNGVVG